jgi:DNA polymerase-3 subunit gamma/tau
VRALLGSFSLESLETVAEALAAGDSRRMLEVVDELERNGHNLQHFSRELARYFRNLLVARIAGADTRLVAASAAQREKLVAIAARFSEEDLTRYLQLSLDLFRDLQFSLQPRFHLEIGLVRLVQAGRLLDIEEALAGLEVPAAASPAPKPAPVAPPPAAAPPPAPAPRRSGPSPFERDRTRKAAAPPPESQPAGTAQQDSPPSGDGGAREKLHAWLVEQGSTHLADAVEHSRIAVSGGELQVTAPKNYVIYLRDPKFEQAVRQVFGRPLRPKIEAGEVEAGPPMPSPAVREGEAETRALSNPEVQRFREVFGGEVRKIRDLKE